MKALILVLVTFLSIVFFSNITNAEKVFPLPIPFNYAVQVVGFCANTNTNRVEIDLCMERQGQKYGEIVLLEMSYHRRIPNWPEVAQKCWDASYAPNFCSFELLLKCLKAEINKGYPQ